MIEIRLTIKGDTINYECNHIASRASDNELIIEDKIMQYVMVDLYKDLKLKEKNNETRTRSSRVRGL